MRSLYNIKFNRPSTRRGLISQNLAVPENWSLSNNEIFLQLTHLARFLQNSTLLYRYTLALFINHRGMERFPHILYLLDYGLSSG